MVFLLFCCLVIKSCLPFAIPWTAACQAPLCPWDFPGKNTTGLGCHFLLQGIFPTQQSNLDSRQIHYHLTTREDPIKIKKYFVTCQYSKKCTVQCPVHKVLQTSHPGFVSRPGRCCNRAELPYQRPSGQHSLNYLLPCPSEKNFVDPCSRWYFLPEVSFCF